MVDLTLTKPEAVELAQTILDEIGIVDKPEAPKATDGIAESQAHSRQFWLYMASLFAQKVAEQPRDMSASYAVNKAIEFLEVSKEVS